MNFDSYKKNEILNFNGKLRNDDIPDLLEYLNKHPEITNLNLSRCWELTDEGFKSLTNSPNAKNITDLDLSYCVKLSDESFKALADSPNLENITKLSLAGSNITDKGFEALVNAPDNKITDLSLYNCREITGATVVLCFEKSSFKNIEFSLSKEQKLYNALVKIRDSKDKPNFKIENTVKDLVFDLAPADEEGNVIRYIIENSAKFPFAINSTSTDGYDLALFYTHSPKMQEFLFKHGMIPPEMKDQTLEEIARDNQSVHQSEAVKKTNFITNELMESTQLPPDKLKESAKEYQNKILPELYKDNNPLAIKLLELTDGEKHSVMKRVLGNNKAPDDQNFIKEVKEKSENILKNEYLNENSSKYKALIQYDWRKGSEKKTTIPESIGLVSELIDKAAIPTRDKQELCVTLLAKNPKLTEAKFTEVKKILNDQNLTLEQLSSRENLHKLLNNIGDDKLNNLFNNVSGFNIDEIWKEQKNFTLAKQLYVAATTYGENTSACIQGTYSQIIDSASEIDTTLLTKFADYKEEEKKQANKIGAINDNNIAPFIETVVNKLKEDETIMKDAALKDALERLDSGMIDVNAPNNITIAEQKILAKINQEFVNHIKDYIPNYKGTNENLVPTREDYKAIMYGMFDKLEPVQTTQIGQPQKNVDIQKDTKQNIISNTKSADNKSFADRVQNSRSSSPQGRGL
ncbi:hypothetical protein [Rickettsia endosymbiont of Seladonia tumulorum]|uniref:hypothetical protein n=3 Tax=unclassified Rickettsia TaxID=114295 RepID=UPI00313AA52C